MSNKIIADVDMEVKEKLKEIAHVSRESMKEVLVRLIDEEFKKVVK